VAIRSSLKRSIVAFPCLRAPCLITGQSIVSTVACCRRFPNGTPMAHPLEPRVWAITLPLEIGLGSTMGHLRRLVEMYRHARLTGGFVALGVLGGCSAQFRGTRQVLETVVGAAGEIPVVCRRHVGARDCSGHRARRAADGGARVAISRCPARMSDKDWRASRTADRRLILDSAFVRHPPIASGIYPTLRSGTRRSQRGD